MRKTECLNYILRKVKKYGEALRPYLNRHRRGKQGSGLPNAETGNRNLRRYDIHHVGDALPVLTLVAEIMDVSTQQTSLGRLVTARAVSSGKALLSGPADTGSLKVLIQGMKRFDVDTTIVDGALSRLSLSSPAVTEAMVLATGAAVSCNIPQLVRKTKYVYDLICLEKAEPEIIRQLIDIEQGMWSIDENGKVHDLNIPSVFMLENNKDEVFKYGNTLYVAGAISDKLLQFLRQQKQIKEITLLIRDFTKVFASMETYYAFLKKGGTMKVLQKSKLLAVCINPQSPEGYCLDSDELRVAMQESLGIPVYDVKKM